MLKVFLPLLFTFACVVLGQAKPSRIAYVVPAVARMEESLNSVYYKYESTPTFHAFGKGNWFMAQAICQQNDMTLAKITDAKENKMAEEFVDSLEDFPGPFWTLANKLYDGTAWAFSFDEPVNYFNWGPNEPTDGIQQNCVELHKDGTWFNTQCTTENYILCEEV